MKLSDAELVTLAVMQAMLVRGIEALGLDVDEELARIDTLPSAFERSMTISEYQLAAIGAQADKLPGDAS